MSSQKLPVSLRETGPHLQRGSLGPPEFTPETSPILQVLTNIQAHADQDTTRYDTITIRNGILTRAQKLTYASLI